MNFVGKIVGRLAFRAFLCCFQKSKVSNGGALQQHRASQDVMFAGSSPVRSAIFYIAVEHPLQKNLHSSSTQSNLLIIFRDVSSPSAL